MVRLPFFYQRDMHDPALSNIGYKWTNDPNVRVKKKGCISVR